MASTFTSPWRGFSAVWFCAKYRELSRSPRWPRSEPWMAARPHGFDPLTPHGNFSNLFRQLVLTAVCQNLNFCVKIRLITNNVINIHNTNLCYGTFTERPCTSRYKKKFKSWILESVFLITTTKKRKNFGQFSFYPIINSQGKLMLWPAYKVKEQFNLVPK